MSSTFDEADKVMSGIQEQRQFAVESLDLAPFGFDIDEVRYSFADPRPVADIWDSHTLYLG